MKLFELGVLTIACFICSMTGYLCGQQSAKPKDCACCVLSPSERKCKSNCVDCKCPRQKIGKTLPCGTTCKCTNGKICASVCECGDKNGKCDCPKGEQP